MTALCNKGTHVTVNQSEYPLAQTLGKNVLYKFRPYWTEEDRTRVREILVDHKVYFARASQVNDPFDLYPCIDIPSRENYLDGLKRHLQRKQIPEEECARQIAVVSSPDSDLREHQLIAQDRTRRRLEDLWVFSLAGNRDHPMLWSHYAGGHTGLCLHFRADEGSLFGAALQVTYSDKRPVIPLDLDELPPNKIIELTTLRKGQFWDYEDEFRFLRPHADSDFPIRFDGQHAFFDPNELCGLTLGARMRADDAEELRKLAAMHVANLPVCQARESRSDYSLEFELLNRAW